MTLYQYSASGLLSQISNVKDNKTYSYNKSSEFYNTEDYGLVTSSADLSDNHGQINELSGPTVDFGFLSTITSGIAYPFGSVILSGSAIVNPNYRLFFSGSSTVKFLSNYKTSGTLFEFGQELENRSYSYNLSSSFDTTDDYGFVSSISGLGDDYGLIFDTYGPVLEYGSILDPIPGIIYPFGKLTLSGSALTQPNYRLYFSGSALEKFIYHPNNLTGTLFGFGEKLESITFVYNQVSTSTNILDYGLLTNVVNEIDDYGNITQTSGSSGLDNYGLITEPNPTEPITYPFGSLFISGSVSNLQIRKSEVGSGKLTISGELTPPNIDYTPAITSTGLINISGTSKLSSRKEYIGSGTLFGFGEKIEKVTYSYNKSSITVDSLDDFGLITNISTTNIDNGFITLSIDDGIDNYGKVTGNPFASTPFGTVTLSGSSTISFQKGPFFPSGSIFVFSGSAYAESFAANPPENTQLFQISGSALVSEIESYVGIGTLFEFGEKLESVTYDYNETSISINEDDFGLIIDSNPQLSDYGLITEFGGGQIDDDYGLISQVVTSVSGYPFGSFVISGSALESDIDSYVGLGTLTLSDSGIPKDIESYVGSGSLFISGQLVHPQIDYTPHYGIDVNIGIGTTGIQITGISSANVSRIANPPENTQLFTISGIATEKVSFNPPENTQLFTISGAYNNLQSTKSIVGFGTLILSGSKVERKTKSYVGLGTISLAGGNIYAKVARPPLDTQLFQISGSALESDIDSYIGVGTLSIDIFSRNYSPVYPRNSGVVGSGIGTIRINDDRGLTITRAVLPYFTKGTIFVSGIGSESFSKSNYPGTGLFNISGIASTKEIAVYTAVGLGTITLSQSSVQQQITSYQSSGVIYLGKYEVTTQSLGNNSLTFDNNAVTFDNSSKQFVYSEAYTTETDAYNGTGTISILRGASESFVIQATENTQLFTISGSGTESYSAQTPETEVLYQFNGTSTNRRTFEYSGSGQLTASSSAEIFFVPKVPGQGLLRFTTRFSDGTYDTCDSADLTCDYQDSAYVKFVANTPENTILFSISGSGLTKEIQVYTYSGSGVVGISGTGILRKTKSFIGIGTYTLSSTSTKKLIHSYNGSGKIAILSGSANSKSVAVPKSTVLFSISGISSTRTFKVKTYIGIGTAYISGSASTKKLSRVSYSGIGTFRLSGQLVYPNIKFVPAPKGFGSININGSGLEKIGRKYVPIIQPLFAFSGGFESFSRSGYVGFGTIYIQSTSASTINNPYQIPRVYVTII